MAKMQNSYTSPCRQTMSGICGSKFVSILVNVSGIKNEIELQAYQVTDQCMSLVKDAIIAPSKNAQLRVRKAKPDQYIPEIMYKATNEYGTQVLKRAEPSFPPDFFIITLRHGAPKQPNPLFKKTQFPIENRLNSKPSLSTVKAQVERGPLCESLADFHLLLFLALQRQLSLPLLQTLTQCVLKRDDKLLEAEALTVLQELLKQVPVAPPTISKDLPSINTSSPPTTGSAKPRQLDKKQEVMVETLMSMGYSQTQSQEALWATSYQSPEAAIDFLLSH